MYLGTPDFAVKPLENLINSDHEIVAVVTNPDKPVGRKKILTAPPVKVLAENNGIKVLQYSKIRVEGVSDLLALKPDLMITCAFGQILSQEIIDIPKFGVVNIHASLLPLYRGASPIHNAILNGDKKTGITLMKTDIGLDTGDILMQEELDIFDDETCGELFDRLSVLGAKMIIDLLPRIEKGDILPIKQDNSKATLTKIFRKEDALISWDESAEKIINKIRAFNPAPVAYTLIGGLPFKIFDAKISGLKGKAGEILKADTELVIGCGDYSVSLQKVQKAGGNPMQISDFLRGNKFIVGEKFI